MVTKNAARRLAPLMLGGLYLLAGCHGTGRVEVAALDFRSIDPPAPHVARVDVDRCYWWTDASGQVWIAMQCDKPVALGVERFVFQLSLVLDSPPAGRARNYLVNKRELRAAARLGPAQSRFVSLAGIVALYRGPGDRLRGSFRLQVAREVQKLLGGWSQPSRHLMMGTFEAVYDEERGRDIALATEADEWKRDETSVVKPSPSNPTLPVKPR